MVYDGETAGELTEDLVRALRDAVKCIHISSFLSLNNKYFVEIPMCRYKLVFQVVMGEYKG